MSFLIRSFSLVYICMAFFSHSVFTMHWEQVQSSIQKSKKTMSYEEAVRYIDLLIDKSAVQNIADDEYRIAGGFIHLNRHSIKSFKDKNGTELEFEYFFNGIGDEPVVSSLKDLEGISIALDVVTDSAYFNSDVIGTLSYQEFVVAIQQTLSRHLADAGAEISYFRPQNRFMSASLESLNNNPPHIVVSPQFNNDQQYCMVTFCGGNILQSELAHARNRARFIQALVTGKHYNSACLAACIAERCQTELQVKPLSWKKASFEGNARPVRVGQLHCALSAEGEYVNGIMTRNLLHNGVFARAVVNPFPDMKWAKEQIVAGLEMEWIEKYTRALADAIVDYVKNNSEVF